MVPPCEVSMIKGNILFPLTVSTGWGKRGSEPLTNMKYGMVNQPSHTTQMFPAEKDILVTAEF